MRKILFIVTIVLLSISCSRNEKRVTEFYPNGKVKCEYDTIGNGKKNGKYIEYYESGKIKIDCYYKNGLGNGFYKAYFENGNLKTYGVLESDKEKGWFTNNFENGNKRQEGEFIIEDKNKPNYLNRVINYDDNGKIIKNRSFYYKCGSFNKNMCLQNTFSVGDTMVFVVDLIEPIIKDSSRKLIEICLVNNTQDTPFDIGIKDERKIRFKFIINKRGENQISGTFFEISQSEKVFHYYYVLYKFNVK